MRVLDTPLKNSIIETFSLDQGNVFTFEDFIITEFNEGSTIDQQCFLHLYQILDIYGEGKEHYGLISNRVNAYSVNTSDLLYVSKVANRKYTSAVVVYDKLTERSAAFELQIYNCGSRIFPDLEKAISWISKKNSLVC